MIDAIRERLDAIALFVLGITCVSSCISEVLARNCVRVLAVMLIINFLLRPETLQKLWNIKFICGSILLWLLIQTGSLYFSGHLAEYLSINTYTISSYTMLLVVAGRLFVGSTGQAVKLIFAMFASLLMMDAYVFYQATNGIDRAVGLVGHTVIVSTMLYAILMPPMVAMACNRELVPVERILAFLSLVLSAAGLLCTNTRGGWLAIFPVLFVMGLYFLPTWKKRLALLLGCLVVAGTVLVAVPSVHNRTDSIARGSSEQSVSERFLMWQSAYNMGRDNLLFGVGKGNYLEKYSQEYISPLCKEPPHDHPHNIFLQVFAEMGLVGEIAFVAMLASFFAMGIRKRKHILGLCLLGSTTALVLYGITDRVFDVYSAMRVYWLLMGISLGGIFNEVKFWE